MGAAFVKEAREEESVAARCSLAVADLRSVSAARASAAARFAWYGFVLGKNDMEAAWAAYAATAAAVAAPTGSRVSAAAAAWAAALAVSKTDV